MASDTHPASRPLRVFLSSTAADLSPYRDAVTKVIELLQQQTTRMETFGARPDSPLAECRRLAADADALVVIVAYRYGWVPGVTEGGDGTKSITWHEVDAAIAAGRPVFTYLADDALRPSDLDPRESQAVERFRAYLGQRIYDRFAGPGDLAAKVSTALARWLMGAREDFAGTLRRIEFQASEIGPPADLPLIRMSDAVPAELIALALTSERVAVETFDRVVRGERTLAAKRTKEAFAGQARTRLTPLREDLAQIEREQKAVREDLAAAPPRRPEEPAGERSPSTQWRWDSYYREVASYERSRAAWQRKRAEGPGRARELGTRHTALQAEIAQFEQARDAELHQLEIEVAAARSRDAVALLNDVQGCMTRALAQRPDSAQGLLVALVAHLLFVVACDYVAPVLLGEAHAIHTDTQRRTDEAVRERGRDAARDLMRRPTTIANALATANAEFRHLEAALGGLPVAELGSARSRIDTVAAREVPKVPAYRHLVAPADLEAMGLHLAALRRKADAESGVAQAVADEVAPLHQLVRSARKVAAAHLRRIREFAASSKPHLAELQLVEFVRDRAGAVADLGETTRRYWAALREEEARRFGMSVGDLLRDWEGTGSPVRRAKDVLARGESAPFAAAHDALVRHMADLRSSARSFDEAINDLPLNPLRHAQAAAKKLPLLTVGALVPVINLLAVFSFSALARKMRGTFSSDLSDYPDYVGLRGTLARAGGTMAWRSALALGVTSGLLWGIHRADVPDVYELWLIGFAASFGVGTVASIWSWVKLRSRAGGRAASATAASATPATVIETAGSSAP